MAAVPDPAVPGVVRGMAAFMQAAKPTDLPAALRPLKGKHHKLLMARKQAITGALEDEGLRALVIDWLEDKPAGISKGDAALLSLAVRRPEGWNDDLAAMTAREPSEPGPTTEAAPDIDRERKRARKARDDARRMKEEAERAIESARQQAMELEDVVSELRVRIVTLESELSKARTEATRARDETEREVRKARRRAEKAEAQLDAAKAEVKELRAAARAKRKPAMAATRPARSTSVAPSSTEPSRRARLAAPKGRLADAPETLTEWLSVSGVRLLVDGYNVTKAEGGFGDLPLEAQRTRLLEGVAKIARRHGIKATIVFDGSAVAPGTSRRARGPLEVEYSRHDETADDHLVAKLQSLPKLPVVVATNDRELQRRVARLGATIATSNQLLALVR